MRVHNICFQRERNNPVGIWCQNDVVCTSMRRDDGASTWIRRHFDVASTWIRRHYDVICIWCQNDVVSTSMRRDDVISTWI